MSFFEVVDCEHDHDGGGPGVRSCGCGGFGW